MPNIHLMLDYIKEISLLKQSKKTTTRKHILLDH